jgi:hypothetical protein
MDNNTAGVEVERLSQRLQRTGLEERAYIGRLLDEYRLNIAQAMKSHQQAKEGLSDFEMNGGPIPKWYNRNEYLKLLKEKVQAEADNVSLWHERILELLGNLQTNSATSSCKSQSSTGRCSTGRHVDRDPKAQKKFKQQLSKRDGRCVATGAKEDLRAAHIVPLNRCELIKRDLYFSPKNGILLRKDLENDYDLGKWYFDIHGNVLVQFRNWPWKEYITKIKLPIGGDAPSAELINLHNELVKENAKHYCPDCWKFVGEVNIKDHQDVACDQISEVSSAVSSVSDVMAPNQDVN